MCFDIFVGGAAKSAIDENSIRFLGGGWGASVIFVPRFDISTGGVIGVFREKSVGSPPPDDDGDADIGILETAKSAALKLYFNDEEGGMISGLSPRLDDDFDDGLSGWELVGGVSPPRTIDDEPPDDEDKDDSGVVAFGGFIIIAFIASCCILSRDAVGVIYILLAANVDLANGSGIPGYFECWNKDEISWAFSGDIPGKSGVASIPDLLEDGDCDVFDGVDADVKYALRSDILLAFWANNRELKSDDLLTFWNRLFNMSFVFEVPASSFFPLKTGPKSDDKSAIDDKFGWSFDEVWDEDDDGIGVIDVISGILCCAKRAL